MQLGSILITTLFVSLYNFGVEGSDISVDLDVIRGDKYSDTDDIKVEKKIIGNYVLYNVCTAEGKVSQIVDSNISMNGVFNLVYMSSDVDKIKSFSYHVLSNGKNPVISLVRNFVAVYGLLSVIIETGGEHDERLERSLYFYKRSVNGRWSPLPHQGFEAMLANINKQENCADEGYYTIDLQKLRTGSTNSNSDISFDSYYLPACVKHVVKNFHGKSLMVIDNDVYPSILIRDAVSNVKYILYYDFGGPRYTKPLAELKKGIVQLDAMLTFVDSNSSKHQEYFVKESKNKNWISVQRDLYQQLHKKMFLFDKVGATPSSGKFRRDESSLPGSVNMPTKGKVDNKYEDKSVNDKVDIEEDEDANVNDEVNKEGEDQNVNEEAHISKVKNKKDNALHPGYVNSLSPEVCVVISASVFATSLFCITVIGVYLKKIMSHG